MLSNSYAYQPPVMARKTWSVVPRSFWRQFYNTFMIVFIPGIVLLEVAIIVYCVMRLAN